MTFRILATWLLLLQIGLPTIATGAKQDSATTASFQTEAYTNTTDGLQKQIDDILQSIKAKNVTKEEELIHNLMIPQNSAWFMNEYGPGFGASLAGAYEREVPGLEQIIKNTYEGNVERGWTTPKLLRFENPDTTNWPTDSFLNSMNKIVPLYQTAFDGSATTFYMPLKSSANRRLPSGDLDGFFVYDQGSFRFIPENVFMKLPSERPIRIKLGMNVMNSKLLTTPRFQYPEEAIQKHISGKVMIHMVIDTQGNIKELKAVQGDPILSGAVSDDMKTWRFEPTKLDGDPVEVEIDWETGFEFH
jgi:TonB family protein